MKSKEAFAGYYQSTLQPLLETLELERKNISRKFYLAALVIVGIFIIGILFSGGNAAVTTNDDVVQNNSFGIGSILLLAGIPAVLGFFFWFVPQKEKLNRRFKFEVIEKMIRFVDESLQYQPSRGLTRDIYAQSKIFVHSVDRYHCEDLISGKIGSTAIRFSEVHSERKHSDGKKTTWTTLFRGILFMADFNKDFKGRTVVVTDQAESFFGGLGTLLQKMNKMRDPLIKLENVEFEKAFAVYGTDAVEAHYVLSPSLMERILDFKKKSGDIELSFVNSNVYISMPVRENLFESSVFSTLLNYAQLEKYFSYLQLVTGIVDDLNLNTRIWTKE